MKRYFYLLVLIIFVFVSPSGVLALSDAQKKLFDQGIYYFDADSSQCTASTTTSDPTQNQSIVFNYFVTHGYTAEQTAGMMGNMAIESHFDSLIWQADRKDYVTPPDPNAPKIGWGIVQWTPSSKIVNYANSTGLKPGDINTQVEFLYKQLEGLVAENSEKEAGDYLKAITTTGPDGATQAADIFYAKYERPAAGDTSLPDREAAAKAALTKFSSGSAIASAVASTSGTSCGACSSAGSSAPSGNTIVIDPGHVPGSTPAGAKDPTTGLGVEDYDNATSERVDAYNASVKIVNKLKADGYNAVDSKSSVDDSFDLGQRAAKDNSFAPQLIVVIHGDPGAARVLMYPDQNSTREPPGGRLDGTKGLVHPEIAGPSQTFAEKMAPVIASQLNNGYKAISFAQFYPNGIGGNSATTGNSGNTPVQTILSAYPEVYSEIDLSVLGSDAFVNAMTAAIETAVGSSSKTTTSGGVQTTTDTGCGAVAGDAVQTALNYSWPEHHNDPYCTETAAYKKAADAAVLAGQYTGADCATDSSIHGVDCGGFITTVMISSGADPQYDDSGKGGNTVGQEQYMKGSNKYQNLGQLTDVSTLQPGDIAINSEHTFMYVGEPDKHPDFKGNVAEASLGTRAPMAANVYFSNKAGPFTWYRLVK